MELIEPHVRQPGSGDIARQVRQDKHHASCFGLDQGGSRSQ
ncbi:hypothetical protein Psesu_2296 [Pseudoxanthomonas suwonensis 11-1]|uniref:Uncharacterized protein n=1 Tax=Pseudoxanthomonas suwonensis (strain 11-1) TaxID=743721 RepID=E6WVD1_PSEUU|nr:hypothetical protein Psesu_2296 [Pseudoxanthomonas suwonensis 11-1]